MCFGLDYLLGEASPTRRPRRPGSGVTAWNGGKSLRGPTRAHPGMPKETYPELAERARGHVLDLQKLETFRVAALTCNFTRAALELGYSQSSVTTHVKAIERALGVRLFERKRFSRNVALTEAGRYTLEYARRLLAMADEMKTAVANGFRSRARKRERHATAGSEGATG